MIQFPPAPIIIFEGQPTGLCKKATLKRESRLLTTASAIGAGVIGVPIVVALLLLSPLDPLWVLGLCLPVLAGFVAMFGLSPYLKGSESSILPSRIIIHENGHMESISDTFHWVQTTEDVAQVIDFGSWYRIDFIPSEKNLRFVCQKDLLTLGTLEEFERIFADQLQRQN